MCGLVGVFGSHIGEPEKRIFRQLVDVGRLRGTDATGIAAVSLSYRKQASVSIVKDNVDSAKFLSDNELEIYKALEGSKQGLLGHHRAATMGENTKDNAHPFTFDDVTGIHNGVLSPSCLSELPSPSDHPVDSAQLFYSIAKSGVDDTIKKTVGDWALIWFDKAKNKFFFLRNKGRPLWYAFSKSKKTMWVVSEPDMGEWVIERNFHPIHEDGWDYFKADTLFSLDATATELELVEERSIEGAVVKLPPAKNSNVVLFPQQKKTTFNSLAEYLKRPLAESRSEPLTSDLLPLLKSNYIREIPVYSTLELLDMSLSSLKDLKDRVTDARSKLIQDQSWRLRGLAGRNWSDRITWRTKDRELATKAILEIDAINDDMSALEDYRGVLVRQISKKELLDSLTKETPKQEPEISMFADVEVRILQHGTDRVLERNHLFSSEAKTETQWVDALSEMIREHNEKFVGFGNYMKFDNDLQGSVNISWTKGADASSSEHQATCKRIHKMLDYLVGPKMKLWDKNYQRHEFFNDFEKACTPRSYGMDWCAPSAKIFEQPYFRKVFFRLVKQAVTWGLNDYKIAPATLAETLLNLNKKAA